MLLKNRNNGQGETVGNSQQISSMQTFTESFPSLGEKLADYQSAKIRLMNRLRLIITAVAVMAVLMLGGWGIAKVWPGVNLAEQYQQAQAQIASTQYRLQVTNGSYYDAGEKIDSVNQVNTKIAKYNIRRDQLPENQRQGLPALPYIH